ncbi:MAG TPA: OsmC family protein [Balneolales bacterium]|nr:OsmC family protein [Balneolales bacterium]
MAIRTASAQWNGNLQDGNGTMKVGSGAYEGSYSFDSRFGEGKGSNPEELIGAAHAGCFSMALSAELSKLGFEPKSVATDAKVSLLKGNDGFEIKSIELTTKANVPGIDKNKFMEVAEGAKKGCPVSKALKGVEIKLNAHLVSE